jgi:DNA anti-recombination protein RmuC
MSAARFGARPSMHDPSLIEFGARQNAILATLTTLIALLRAIAYAWRQEKLAQNAAEISALGKESYKRLSDMGDHWSKVGKSLERAVEAYNRGPRRSNMPVRPFHGPQSSIVCRSESMR